MRYSLLKTNYVFPLYEIIYENGFRMVIPECIYLYHKRKLENVRFRLKNKSRKRKGRK